MVFGVGGERGGGDVSAVDNENTTRADDEVLDTEPCHSRKNNLRAQRATEAASSRSRSSEMLLWGFLGVSKVSRVFGQVLEQEMVGIGINSDTEVNIDTFILNDLIAKVWDFAFSL